MDRAGLLSFIKIAEAALISARGSLLLISQGGAKLDLAPLAAQIANIAEIAAPLGLSSLAEQANHGTSAITEATTPENAYKALDAIVRIEAELLSITLPDDIDDVTEFVDDSLGNILNEQIVDASPRFEIDDETLEIFRSEGEELLANISLGIDMLAASPADQNALWDIRRCAHTFKGAAGIVGLGEAASVAHRMEDLLDRLVESNGSASDAVVDFLRGCVRSLGAVLDGHPANAAGLELAFSGAVTSLDGGASAAHHLEQRSGSPQDRPAENKPVVRVSLDRLSEIVVLAEQLLADRTSVKDGTRDILAEIHDRILRIRLVRFGMLEARLTRAVSLTAIEENKKAVIDIETPDAEIDTLILDALVEPLLHLIKNAVVHGVEPPEVRRMLGKHEFGLVSIRVDSDGEAVVVTVSDDGAGIAVDKLKQCAVDRHAISAQTAATMTDRDAYKLLFDKGLSTIDNITLNAGRGVGMSIVKESVESRGGSIHIDSTPQLGTSFTLMLPVQLSADTRETITSSDLQKRTVVATPETHRPEVSPSHPLTSSSSAIPLVLIVDDSSSIRRHTQMIVEEAGFRSITAKDGADALELLLSGSVEPHLILSDVEMPNIDGWELLKYLKTDDHLGHIPVVLVTSLDGDNHRSLAASLGAADYVVKPFSTNDIEQVLLLVAANAIA